MPKPKRVDPIKQREKRAKIAAAVGGALFLVVAAIEVPPVLKHNSPPPAAASTSTTNTATTPTTTPTATGSTAAAAPAPGELADTDVPPPAQTGELVSFSMFQAKNPFAPQVTDSTDSSSSSSTPTAPTTAEKHGADVPGSTTTTTPAATTTTPAPPAGTSVVPATSSSPASTTPTQAAAPAVAISVNGSVSRVATGATFPVAQPVFRLVSFDNGTAQVGIVGGSYAAGGATLTLHLHTPVTLENQTDGKRYTLELDSTP